MFDHIYNDMSSLSNKLESMLGAEVAKEIIEMFNAKDAMKKYAASDKGKAARKRANQNYVARHGRRVQYENDTNEDVLHYLNRYVNDARTNLMIGIDQAVPVWIEANPLLYRTGSELWKAYKDYSGSKLTRCRFLTLLPEMNINPFIMRGVRKVHTPAYAVPFMDYYDSDLD